MSQVNTTIIVGYLVRDPERKTTRNGVSLGVFTVAANHRYKDQQGQPKEEVAFVPCIVFGSPATWLMEHRKGTLVIVSGRLRTESWEGSNGTMSKLVLVVDNLQFVQSLKRPTSQAASPAVAGPLNGEDDSIPF